MVDFFFFFNHWAGVLSPFSISFKDSPTFLTILDFLAISSKYTSSISLWVLIYLPRFFIFPPKKQLDKKLMPPSGFCSTRNNHIFGYPNFIIRWGKTRYKKMTIIYHVRFPRHTYPQPNSGTRASPRQTSLPLAHYTCNTPLYPQFGAYL